MPYKYARHAQPEKSYTDVDLTLENESLPLGPEGFGQAKTLAIKEQRKPFQLILSSPFIRTKQTAETVQKEQDNTASLVLVPELHEVHFGKPTRGELKGWITTGLSTSGESVAQARERIRNFISSLKQYGDVHGLIVAHKLLYSVFLLEFEEKPDDTPVSQLDNNHKLDFAECVQLPEFK